MTGAAKGRKGNGHEKSSRRRCLIAAAGTILFAATVASPDPVPPLPGTVVRTVEVSPDARKRKAFPLDQGSVLWQRTAVPGLPDRIKTYSYDSLGVRPECLCLWKRLEDDGETEFFTARVETESVGGEVVSKTLRFLATDNMQHRIVEEVKLADPTVTDLVAAWSAEGNVRHYIDYMPKNENKPCSEKKSLEVHQDGTVDVYSYSAGVYTPGTDGAAGVFVDSGCGEGDWFRTVVTHYPVQPTMDFSESNTVRFVQLPYQSTREVTIEMRSKKETVLSEKYVCTGIAPDDFVRIFWTSTSRDALGRTVSAIDSSGIETRYLYAIDSTLGLETRWTDFYRRWISLYCGEMSKFLVRGRRIRAPEVRCEKSRLGGEGREVDAVCTAAYRADDGEEAAILVNATWREQTVEISWGGLRKTVVVTPGGIVMTSMRERD